LRPFLRGFFEGMRNYKSSEERDLAPLLGHRFLLVMAAIAWN
jgi:hypothetical protein